MSGSLLYRGALNAIGALLLFGARSIPSGTISSFGALFNLRDNLRTRHALGHGTFV
jgi:hypothetical protein